jgi:hypothetical protein
MQATYQFIPGIQLNEGFFFDVVKPLIEQHYPGLSYSAALIGYGSDVLGIDTAVSMDHDWGPRLQIFLTEQDFVDIAPKLHTTLREHLPVSYKGFPTNYTDKRADFTQSMLSVETGPVNHLIERHTIASFVKRSIGADISQEIVLTDWLTFPEQGLIELTRGMVYYDGLGNLNRIRESFACYPKDIWLIKMAVLWHAVSEEEAFIGRCNALGDELGAQIITTRIVNFLMKLCFYLEKQYIPYSKWFGTSFNQLKCAPALKPVFLAIVNDANDNNREAGLAEAYRIIGNMHNRLGVTEPIDFTMRNFYGRPYQVVFAERIVESLKAAIDDQSIKNLDLVMIGVEQLTDGIDMTEQKKFLREMVTFSQGLHTE